MLEGLKSYGLYGTTYCAIECTTQGSNPHFFGVTAKKRKGEYTDINEFECSDVTETNGFLSKNQHCHLVINTDKVLIKETALKQNNADMISEAFPGLSVKDFFIDVYATSTKCFVAICRKEIVQALIKDFELEKIEVLSIRIGFGVLQPLLSYFQNTTIATQTYTLATDNDAITSFIKDIPQTNTYTLEDIEINSSHLLALSALFGYGTQNINTGDLEEYNRTLTTSQYQKVFFRKGIYVAIGILAIILMINTLLFTNYYGKYQNLKATVATSSAQKENYKKMQEQVEKKEQMVANILQSGSSKSSFYINRLAAGQPKSVQLSVIDYQPLERSIQTKKPIVYSNNILNIEGKSNDKIDFNNWIATLEQQAWVESVTVGQYAQSNSNNATFEIIIKLEADATEN